MDPSEKPPKPVRWIICGDHVHFSDRPYTACSNVNPMFFDAYDDEPE